MVVHLCEAKILERHMSQARKGRIDIHSALPNLFEERPKLIAVHDARITEPSFPLLRSADKPNTYTSQSGKRDEKIITL